MKGHTSVDYLLSERERKSLVILELIRKKGPISRMDIAKSADTNIVTVSNYVDNYIRKGLVLESGLDISSGGRKPTLIELNPQAGFAVGVDLSVLSDRRREAVALICDLSGKEIVKVRQAMGKESAGGQTEELAAIINKIIEKAGIEKNKLKGVGLSTGSGNDEEDTYFTVKEELEQRFRLPVFMSNNATFAAFGEKMLGLGENSENMLYIYSAVGCGIIIKGNIYCGTGGTAGEVGVRNLAEKEFFRWSREPYYLKPEGQDFGISAQAKRVINEGLESKIRNLAGDDMENITAGIVIKAAKAGDKLAEELLENAGVELGIRIAYLVNLFNPEVVVIGGGIEDAGSIFLDPVRKTVKKWAFEASAKQAKIMPACLGEDAVVRGAASIVVREVFIKAYSLTV